MIASLFPLALVEPHLRRCAAVLLLPNAGAVCWRNLQLALQERMCAVFDLHHPASLRRTATSVRLSKWCKGCGAGLTRPVPRRG